MYEYIVGLDIVNDELYDKYRKFMMPILNKYGGGFKYDFKIQQTLKSSCEENINRVFLIYFPSKIKADEFFSNKEYLLIKDKYFTPSVKSTTIISSYEVE